MTAANAEPDKAKRKDLYNQLNDLFIDESFLMVLSTTPARALAKANVKNVRNQAHGGFMFTETGLEGLRVLLRDSRAMDSERYGYLRRELGVDDPPADRW